MLNVIYGDTRIYNTYTMRKRITEIILWLTKFRVNFTGKIPQSIGKLGGNSVEA